jgi:signal transduction histidine kinase
MRRQLIAVTLAATVMVVVAFAVPLGVTVATLADTISSQDADAAASQLARAVGTALDDPASLQALVAGAEVDLVVFLPDGVVGTRPDFDGLDAALDTAWSGEGLSIADDDLHLALLPVFGSEPEPAAVAGASTIRGAKTSSVRTAWIVLGALSVALIGLGVALADRLGQRLVGSVESLADAARRMAAGDLDAVVAVEGPPEIQETATAFNSLGRRIRSFLQDEREAVADLSHQLRTPLTALRLETEGTSAAPIVDELSAAVDDVIRSAREPARRHGEVLVEVRSTVADRLRFWSALADEEDRTIESDLGVEDVVVQANPRDLAASFDALVGNVFAHTPPGTPFRVTLESSAGRCRLRIEDGGPGFDASLLERGASVGGSTGLGLDICSSFARSAGGSFEMVPSALGGAGLLVDIPSVG